MPFFLVSPSYLNPPQNSVKLDIKFLLIFILSLFVNSSPIFADEFTPPTLSSWFGNETVNTAGYEAWGDISDTAGIDYIEFTLNDGADWTPCDLANEDTAYVCRPTLTLGINNLIIRAMDLAGNLNSSDNWISSEITYENPPPSDTTPPTIIGTNTSSPHAINGSFDLTGTATDESSIVNISYSINNGSNWTPCTTSDLYATFTCSITDLYSPSHNVLVRGTDSLSNQNDINSWLSVDIHSQNPFISINSIQSISTGTSLSFGGTTVSDIGISAVQFRSIGTTDSWQNCTTNANNFTCLASDLENQTGYYYQIRAIDNSSPNLISYSLPSKYIYVDQNSKITRWWPMEYLEFGTTTGNVSLVSGRTNSAVSFNENNAKIDVSDTGGSLSFDQSTSKFTIDFWLKPQASATLEGNYYNIIGKRNSADTNFNWEILIDSQGSVMAAIYPNGIRQSIGEFELSTQVTKDEWNHVVFSYNYPERNMYLKLGNNQPIISSLETISVLPSSTNPVIVSYNNFQGQIDDLIFSQNAYETKAPSINITPLEKPARITINNPQFNLTILDDNGIASAEYLFLPTNLGENLDDKDWIPITTNNQNIWGNNTHTATITAPQLNDGEWFLYIRSTDSNGNKSTYNNSGWFDSYGTSSPQLMAYYRFVIETTDNNPPDIYANAIIPNPTVDKNVAIHGFVKDYLLLNEGDTPSNISSIYYKIDNGNFISVNPLDGNFDSPLEEFNISTTGLSLGTHTIEIKATDAAGNSTSSITYGQNHSNYKDSFDIVTQTTTNTNTTVIKEEDFTTKTNMDRIFTTGIWGNGMARLKQSIGYTFTDTLFTNNTDYGYVYGDTSLDLFSSTDDNYFWNSVNKTDFLYINKTNNSYTRYSGPTPNIHISNILEFDYDNHRYLLLSQELFNPTYIRDLNDTPTNSADDTTIQYSTGSSLPSGYESWKPYSIDTRDNTFAIWAIITSNDANIDDFIVRIDTKNTIMDSSDDTYTYFNRSMGLLPMYSGTEPTVDFTTAHFDPATGEHVLASYDWGIFVCSDSETPDIQENFSCSAKINTTNTSYGTFSIFKDTNNYYWLAGNEGIKRFSTNNTVSQSDDTWTYVLQLSNISQETPVKIFWHQNDYPVGDEIMFLTREGHIRSLEYNNTYDDTLDDTSYDYQIPSTAFRNGGGMGILFDDKNTIWLATQSTGTHKIKLSRGFEDSNNIEFLPIPPEGMLAINNLKLDSVAGDVSTNSSSTFSELTSYQVSNNGGVTWYPITAGQTVNFPTADYRLKFKIVLNKGSTPIVDLVRFSYVAYSDPNYLTNTSSVTTPSNQPSGNTCTASAPGIKRPFIYQAKPMGKNKIALFFYGGDQPFNKYSVIFGTKSNKYTFSGIDIGGKNDKYIIVDALKPNTSYFFRIFAQNDCAQGGNSNEISARTGLTNYLFKPSLFLTSSKVKTYASSSSLHSLNIKVSNPDKTINSPIDIIVNQKKYTTNNGVLDVNNLDSGKYFITIVQDATWVNKTIWLSGQPKQYQYNFVIAPKSITIWDKIKKYLLSV